MSEPHAKSPGSILALVLKGAWRSAPTAFECSAAELEKVMPLLQNSGAAALAWWRVSRSELSETPLARALKQEHRAYVVRDALRQRTIEKVVTLLRSAAVEPMLTKGWAAARVYPERGLRPFGDADLCVRPEQFAAARAALRSLTHERYEVDLHCGFAKFGGGRAEEFFERSQLVKLGATQVRVPSAEDHLRILAVHLLREGAWRPLWLCDVAAALESRGADFDWKRCLTKESRLANWVLCVLGAAHELIGANTQDTPAENIVQTLPRWLVPAILKEWERPSMPERRRAPMANLLRGREGIVEGLRHRWPNPIEATVRVGAKFNAWPRLPLQLGNCLARTVKFAAQLPRLRREQ